MMRGWRVITYCKNWAKICIEHVCLAECVEGERTNNDKDNATGLNYIGMFVQLHVTSTQLYTVIYVYAGIYIYIYMCIYISYI